MPVRLIIWNNFNLQLIGQFCIGPDQLIVALMGYEQIKFRNSFAGKSQYSTASVPDVTSAFSQTSAAKALGLLIYHRWTNLLYISHSAAKVRRPIGYAYNSLELCFPVVILSLVPMSMIIQVRFISQGYEKITSAPP